MSDSCGLIINILLLFAELIFHAMIFLFLPYTGDYAFFYNEKLKNAVCAFSIINSLVAIITLILIFIICCYSVDYCYIYKTSFYNYRIWFKFRSNRKNLEKQIIIIH